MTFTLSPQIKILAGAGLLGAVALGGGLMLLGSSSSTATAPQVIKPLHGHLHAVAPTATPNVAAKAKAKAKAKAAVHPAAKAKHVAKPATKHVVLKVKPNAALDPISGLPANGLPVAVNQALARHVVVVVSLFDPQADVDAASLGEAMAGAKLAGVGFVPLNVLSQKEAEPLAKKLGILPDPALLVYRRPGTLVVKISGFADRETVAQAAASAAR